MQKAVEITVDGKTLRGMSHIPEGRGGFPCVIMFHGFTGTRLEPHYIFRKLSRLLENKGIASLRFDFGGAGESDGNYEDTTFSGEVREAEAILDFAQAIPEVDKTRIGLVGLSMGGAVTTALAGKRAAEIKAAALWAPASMPDMLKLFETRGKKVTSDKELYDFDGNLVGINLYHDFIKWDTFAEVKKYQGPVMIFHGSADNVIPPETGQRYKESLGERAGLHFIQGADHTFNGYAWEKEVLEKTVDFLMDKL